MYILAHEYWTTLCLNHEVYLTKTGVTNFIDLMARGYRVGPSLAVAETQGGTVAGFLFPDGTTSFFFFLYSKQSKQGILVYPSTFRLFVLATG
jgi:hypothetical protein